LNAEVIRVGTIHVGDGVDLVRSTVDAGERP
jgi:hypothetical protein